MSVPPWFGDVLTVLILIGAVAAIWLGVRRGRRNKDQMISSAEARGEARAMAAVQATQAVSVPVSVAVGAGLSPGRFGSADENWLAQIVARRPELVADMLRRPWAYEALGVGDGRDHHDNQYHYDNDRREFDAVISAGRLGPGGERSTDATECGDSVPGGDARARGRGPGS